jgi:hypothetical protein
MSLAAALTLSTVFAAAAPTYPAVGMVQVREGDDPAWSRRDFDDTSWDTRHYWRVDPQGRMVWIRAHITMPPGLDTTSKPLGVHFSATASYEAWWNGVRVASNGVPATTAAGEAPGRIDSVMFIPPNLIERDNVLALRLSSFHLPLRLGGPMQGLVLRPFSNTTADVLREKAPTMIAIGALLLGAFYFAGLYISNRQDRSSLLLALLTLSILGQLIAESVRAFYNYAYPLHILRVEAILAFAALTSVLLVTYVADRYAPAWRTRLIGITIASTLIIIALTPGFDSKTTLVILAGTVVASIAAAVGLRRRAPGARIVLAATIAAFVLFILDSTGFLDRTWYLEAVVLVLLLFWQQVRSLRETQNRRARLELELLKQQIQPHFLMNSLTALTEWVESDPAAGVRMIEALAEEFRSISAMTGATTVTMAQEIELCRLHLRVMSLRQNQPFELRAENVRLDALVPPAIFHTLIENALTHNHYTDGAVFLLEEDASTPDRRVYRLRTPLMRTTTATSTGHGHRYVRARLRDVFGERWRFSSGPQSSGEWTDSIEMPAH